MISYKKLIIKSFAIALFFVCYTAFAENKPAPETAPVNYLFLQNASSGILKATKEHGTYQLILQNVQPNVIYFSDRPDRITGSISLDKFLKEWQKKNGFKTDAPNVGIEGIKLHAFSRDQEVSVIMILSNPIYDKKSNSLTYTARALNTNQSNIKNNIKLSNITLFIDNFGSCPSCCCG